MNAGKDPTDHTTLFFAGGQGKSGTTWVQLLLDAHPRVSCRGEAHFFDFLAPALQQGFLRYRHQLEENNKVFHELPGYPLPEQSEAFATLRAAVLAAMQNQADGARLSAIGERTPANVEHLDLIWALFPAARFIHVVRDPRDVAVSLWHHGQRIDEGGFARQYGSVDALAEHLAEGWTSWMRRSATLGQAHPDLYCEVRYEDLLAGGAAALQGMLQFLGVTATEGELTQCLRAGAFEKLSGGRQRGEEDRSSHFRKGVSGDWRNHLSRDAITKINRTAAAEFERLGYATD